MNRDDIIRMALEVGFVAYGEDAGEYRIPTPAFHNRLERFAALVAAAERDSMIKQGWRQCAKDQRTTQFCGMVEQAVQEEREACAKVCDDIRNDWKTHGDEMKTYAAEYLANAIRARGN